jgi:hypothetical protein
MEIYERAIAIPIILAAIALTVITTYLNKSSISYRKAITNDRSSGGGVVGAIVCQVCDFNQFTKSPDSEKSNNASPKDSS